jgi:NAD(P)-dependent dehydrogenase (short-subunit alcohol dehydrogenase family)
VNFLTMQHRGRTPYGPSKAALESETQIWAQELAGTGVTVNAILPGGGTLTGMIPDSYPEAARKLLLDPDIIVPPLLYLASAASDGVTGKRFNANKWRGDLPVEVPAGSRGRVSEKQRTPGSFRNLGFINSGNVLLSHNL